MLSKIYRVIQPVTDIEKASKFYARIFEDIGTRVSDGRHYFDCGGVVLACYSPKEDGDELGEGWRHHESQYVYFSVSDLEKAFQRVKDSGGTDVTEIGTMPWGERLFYAKDIFGNPISFVDENTVFTGKQA